MCSSFVFRKIHIAVRLMALFHSQFFLLFVFLPLFFLSFITWKGSRPMLSKLKSCSGFFGLGNHYLSFCLIFSFWNQLMIYFVDFLLFTFLGEYFNDLRLAKIYHQYFYYYLQTSNTNYRINQLLFQPKFPQ